MKRIQTLTVLMVLSLMVIAGFQVYWLWENYVREKKSLDVRTGIAFRESVLKLQASKLKLKIPDERPDNFHYRVTVDDAGKVLEEKSLEPKKDFIGMVNVIRDKVEDSANKKKTQLVISLDKSTYLYHKDSTRAEEEFKWNGKEDKLVRFLYGIDSLQDSLSLKDVEAATQARFIKERLNVPFCVVVKDSVQGPPDFENLAGVRVGLSKPTFYQMELGNTFPYLARRLLSPFLFSLFLLGVTLVSFLLLYRNLLQQKRLAEQKNEFISNVTHELKTPIATVNVAIEALRNFNAISDPVRTKEYLDISQNELQRLSLLVDKVLKLSMFENKEVQLHFTEFSFDEVIDEVLGSLRLQIEKRQATVNWTKEGHNFKMQGDRLHMVSVIYNLLDNALKYSEGKPLIQMHLKEEEKNLVLMIRDNGIGIPPAYQAKIFDKFFRVPHGDTHNVKGYGLGLSYVSHIVSQHKGSISLESEIQKGTKFIITLPKNENA